MKKSTRSFASRHTWISRYDVQFFCCVVLALSFVACRKADHLFSNLPARFKMENIYQAQVLYTACNSMGQFCTITTSGKEFIFKSLTRTDPVPITGNYVHEGFYLGLSGLIVGLPEIPEMGRDVSQVVCFDLACSNCYHDYSITKPLELQENGMAHCKSCQRTYNLNNVGRTDNGKPLIRYRVSLVGNTLIVANN